MDCRCCPEGAGGEEWTGLLGLRPMSVGWSLRPPRKECRYQMERPERLSHPDSSTKMLSSRIVLPDKKKAGENVPGTWMPS